MKKIRRKGATKFKPVFRAAFFVVLLDDGEDRCMRRLQIKDIQTDGVTTRIIVWK